MLKHLHKHRIKIFFILSVLFHILMISSSALKYFLFQETSEQKEELVEVILLPEQKEAKQLVDRQKDPNEKVPNKANFLSNKNNQVEKEVKRKPTPFQKPSSPQKAQKQTPKQDAREKLDGIARVKDMGELPPLEKLKLSFKDLERNSQRLIPPEATDYLPNVKEKDRTALNTREFVFFSFYERMKKRLGMFWTPALEEKFRKMYYANIEVDNRDLITKLVIVLDEEGNIKRIEKIQSSGFDDLDDAAIEAFTRAAPFSNPPRGILDADKTLVIKWDFILKTNVDTIGSVLSQL